MDVCGKCSDNFVVSSKFVQCACCNDKYHNVCMKVKDVVSKTLQGTENLVWYCDHCIGIVKQNNKLLSAMKVLKAKTDLLLNNSKQRELS